MRKLYKGTCIEWHKGGKGGKDGKSVKKVLSLVLTYTLLLTALGTLFSVGVVARQNGDIYFDGGMDWYKTYWYDSDESAIKDGAIAKFTHKSGDTVYVKTWEMVMTIGGEADNGSDILTLIADSTGRIAIDPNTKQGIGKHTFTIEGNGITVESSDEILIDGKNGGHVTLKNVTLINTSETSATLKLGYKSNEGPKVTLDNVRIVSEGSPSKATVLVQASNLVLTNGSSIVNEGEINASNGNCQGVRLFGTSPSLEINENTSIESSGDAVYTETKANITVNGGRISSAYGRALYVSNGSESAVNGGSLYGGGEAVAQVSDGTLTISGGSFCTQSKDDTDVAMMGVIVSGDARVNGGRAVINGGKFYDVSGRAEWIFNCNASKDGKHSLELNAATTFGNCNVYSGKKGEGVIKTGTMLYGASVRTQPDSSGIRFQSTLDKSIVENIRAIDENAVIGTVIAPYDYVEMTEGIFTKEALLNAGLDCLEIPAEKGMSDKETYYLINAAMTDIKEKNYGRDFAAVSYISYKTSENSSVTAYGGFDAEDNVRSMVSVAYSALADVMVDGAVISDTVTVTREYAKERGYGNVVSEWYEYDKTTGKAELKQGMAYTEYSSAQLKLIKAYIDAYVKGVED